MENDINVRFEKVSFPQFAAQCRNLAGLSALSDEAIHEAYDRIELPSRSSAHSAGYDIHSPFAGRLTEDHPIELIPLGIRVILRPDQFLMIVPRSGLGFKTGMHLANTVGVIDADYSRSSNEGHMMAELCRGFADLEFAPGDRILQGIILNYDIISSDGASGVRDGGFGSSGR